MTNKCISVRRTPQIGLLCASLIAFAVSLMAYGAAPAAAAESMTVAQIAKLNGADREKILVQGAKAEGHLTLYTSNANTKARKDFIDGFEREYPFIKVDYYRADSTALEQRIAQEYSGDKNLVDVVEGDPSVYTVLEAAIPGMFQNYYSPELAHVRPDLLVNADSSDRTVGSAVTVFSGLVAGWNTKMVPSGTTIHSWDDLLKPVWKGRMALPSSTTGSYWIGAAIQAKGQEWVTNQLAKQDVKLVTGSGHNIADAVAQGQYAMTPAMFNTFYLANHQAGYPVARFALQPVWISPRSYMLPSKAPHPYSAMLMIDYTLKNGADVYLKAGYWSGNSSSPKAPPAEWKLFIPAMTFKPADLDKQLKHWKQIEKQITSP
jgi:ABC-type Fe3+ transport system substrate-binding protein